MSELFQDSLNVELRLVYSQGSTRMIEPCYQGSALTDLFVESASLVTVALGLWHLGI